MNRAEYLQRHHEFHPRGNQLPHARLTPVAVREIRINRRGETAAQLAARFGVHIRTIEKVRHYETWRHIQC